MKKIAVSVKTRSKIEVIKKIAVDEYEVKINTPPVDGKGNLRIIELLSRELGIPKSKIQLSKGEKSKKKIFIVID